VRTPTCTKNRLNSCISKIQIAAYLDAAGSSLDDSLNHLEVLLLREGGRLAGGAAGHDTGSALLHVPLDEALDAIVVDLISVGERGNESHVGAEQLKLGHSV